MWTEVSLGYTHPDQQRRAWKQDGLSVPSVRRHREAVVLSGGRRVD